MSAFGKYGTGGSIPGKWPGAPDETAVAEAASIGTEKNQPDSRPESEPAEGSYKS